MTYHEALSYLYSFFNLEHHAQFSYRRELNLERMRKLLDWFNHPERQFKSVLIAGTKGKGSTAFFLHSMLVRNGIQAGLYTSPHLSDFRERFRTNQRFISKDEIARLVLRIKKTVEKRRPEIRKMEPITFFEISTLLAFLFFAERKINWAVLEVGMGGRLDATNAVRQSLSVLTVMGLDHEEHLGRTISKIAGEKAAILKPNVPFVSARQPKEALQVIRSKAKRTGSRGFFSGAHFNFRIRSELLQSSRFDFKMGKKKLKNCVIRLPGRFQVENASAALAALTVLENELGLSISDERIRRGLLETNWPGRFEILKRRSGTCILDGAHNGTSVLALSRALRRFFPDKKVITIFGTSYGKNLHAILPVLARNSEVLIATQADHPRAQLSKWIAESARPFFRIVIPTGDIQEAIRSAERIRDSKTVLLVTGSLFLVGEARAILCNNKRERKQ